VEGEARRSVLCPACHTIIASSAETINTSSEKQPPKSQTKPSMQFVNRFAIKGKLGSGAFGVVFKAYDPQLERDVALKMPHPGSMNSPKRIDRFMREAKAVANLRHPHIVPVYDAGKEGSHYYIASAFIEGQPLSNLIAEKGNPPKDAARFVRELAEALAYAHDQGIVHRDIKPANIMIDKARHVHLMDFGLAFRQDDEARATNEGSLLGTPSYMSPEQAAGKVSTVGPLSDQYSAGVVLYELLTGTVPFTGPIPVVIHGILEKEPPTPRGIKASIPKDLEIICLKAMAKQPEKRYPHCRALADDLRRWMEGDSIKARRLSPLESAVRWVKRNRGVAALAALLLVTLVAGCIISLWQLNRALQAEETANLRREEALAAEKLANQRKEEAQAIATAEKAAKENARNGIEVILGIFKELDMEQVKEGNEPLEVILGERLKKAAEQLEGTSLGDEQTVAKLQTGLGQSLISLGFYKEAIPLLIKARTTRTKLLGNQHDDSVETTSFLASAYIGHGQTAIALDLYKELLVIRQARLRSDDPKTLRTMSNIAACYYGLGRVDESVKLLEQLVPKMRVNNPTDRNTLNTMCSLASAYQRSARYEESLALFKEALPVLQKTTSEDHPKVLLCMYNIAVVYTSMGKFEEALETGEQVYQLRKAKMGLDHPNTIASSLLLAQLKAQRKEYDQAIAILTDAISRLSNKYDKDHVELLGSKVALAKCYTAINKVNDAVSLYEELLARLSDKLPAHDLTYASMFELVRCYQELDRKSDALALLEEKVKFFASKAGDDHPNTIRSRNLLFKWYMKENRREDAIRVLDAIETGVDEKLKSPVGRKWFDYQMHNELRHHYGNIDKNKSMKHVDIILRFSCMDSYMMNICLPGPETSSAASKIQTLEKVLTEFKQFKYLCAAVKLKIAELTKDESLKNKYLQEIAAQQDPDLLKYQAYAKARLQEMSKHGSN